MKSLLLKSVLLVVVYSIIISAAIVNSLESAKASNNLQNSNAQKNYSYNSSFNNSSISFFGKTKIDQAPSTISVGNGYYSSHPIGYGSEIGSQTLIKNQRSSVSMQQDINYANGVNGQTEVMATDRSHSIDDVKSRGFSSTHMKIDENVTSGHVHIGVLQGSNNQGRLADGTINSGIDSTVDAWKKPALEIDEDYIGTYHIYKNMTLQTSYSLHSKNESWLGFCSGGYFDMNWPSPLCISGDKIFNCKVANPWKTLAARQK